ncbi:MULTISPECIES: DUF952 domain-containing protein [Trichocoleus]|uniref:DUF952 domain-containing protein n=1 Tax=Trichocoleus desertorum GB2-A4 TaxID=2933944 RepID=A0ABV0J3Z9_9CYAN|nr:DUF952 domain-containing protein [Trichocoleus sp. FACHB-46]MBD1860369.1 DUF952 domain-containing protein [Trichocoleus sp. FACHB-46]
MPFIFHITSAPQWEQDQLAGIYQGDTLASEGFIHCSTLQQVEGVANRYFTGQTDLLLLCINSDQVQAEIKYKALVGDEEYPHIYGPLNLDAVTEVAPWAPQPDGTFALPAAIANS